MLSIGPEILRQLHQPQPRNSLPHMAMWVRTSSGPDVVAMAIHHPRLGQQHCPKDPRKSYGINQLNVLCFIKY